jgi:hypothetical protein
MAKIAKIHKNTWGIVGLEFIGSLIFLAVAFTAGLSWTSAWQWWQTIFFAVGLVGAVSLFFMTFGNFGMMKTVSSHILKTAMVTSVVLIALEPASWSWICLVLIGFALEFMGSAWGTPKEW